MSAGEGCGRYKGTHILAAGESCCPNYQSESRSDEQSGGIRDRHGSSRGICRIGDKQ
jgi:hypothetical protein